MPNHLTPPVRASRLTLSVLAVAIASFTVMGCGSSTETPTNTDCTGTVPKYSQLATTALTKCTSCHSSTLMGGARMLATVGIDYNTYAAAKANATDGASQVNQGLMPFGDATKLTAQEKTDFLKWASCGTPQ